MASAIRRDELGNRIVVQTSADEVGILPGETFVVIGDALEIVGRGVYFLADRAHGREPTAHEQASVRTGYHRASPSPRVAPKPDEQLAERPAS